MDTSGVNHRLGGKSNPEKIARFLSVSPRTILHDILLPGRYLFPGANFGRMEFAFSRGAERGGGWGWNFIRGEKSTRRQLRHWLKKTHKSRGKRRKKER